MPLRSQPRIRDALVKLSPQDALLFETNRSAFIDALDTKIEGWKKMLAPFRGAKMVVVHDSWSYFAEQLRSADRRGCRATTWCAAFAGRACRALPAHA